MPQSVDGDIRLSASFNLDTTNVKQRAQDLKKTLDSVLSTDTKGNPKLEKLQLQLQKSYETVIKLHNKLQEAQNVKTPTERYVKLQSEIDSARKKLNDLADEELKWEKRKTSGTGTEKMLAGIELKRIDEEARKADAQLSRLQQQARKLEESGNAFKIGDQEQVRELSRQLAFATQNGEQLRDKFDEIRISANEATNEAEKTEHSSSKIKNALHGAGTAAKSFARVAKLAFNGLTKAIRGITLATNKVKASFAKLKDSAKNVFHKVNKDATSGLKKLLRYGLGIRGLFMLFRKLRGYATDAFKGIAQQSASFNKTMSNITNTFSQFKGSIGTMLQPLISAVEPVLIRLMELFINAANAVASFFATLTGQKYIYKAVKANNSYADSVSGTGKAAKEANKQLAEYDKLMVIASQDAADSAGGGGAGGGGFTEELVDPSNSISQFAQDLKDAWNAEDFEAIGNIIADKINGMVAKIDNAIKWDNVKDKIEPFIDNMATAFNSLVDNIHWDEIGQTVGDGINTITYTIEHALDEFDFDELGSALAGFVNGVNTSADWDSLGRTAAKGLNELTSAINKFTNETDWKALGQNGSTSLQSFLKELNADQLGSAFAAPIESINKTLNGFLTQFTDDGGFTLLGQKIGTSVNSWFNTIDWVTLKNNVKLGINGITKTLKGFVTTTDWETIGKDIGTLINGLFEVDWADLIITLKDGVKGIGTSLATALQTIELDSVASTLSGTIGAAIGSAFDLVVFTYETFKTFLDNLETAFVENVSLDWLTEHLGQPFTNALVKAITNVDINVSGIGPAMVMLAAKAWNFMLDNISLPGFDFADPIIDLFKIDEDKLRVKLHLDVVDDSENGIENTSETWNSIDNKEATLTTDVKDNVPNGTSGWAKVWGSVKDKTAEIKTSLKDEVPNGGTVSFKTGILDKIGNVKATIETILKDNVPDGGTRSFKTGILDKIGDIKATITTVLSDNVPEGGTKSWISGVWDKIKDRIAKIDTSLQDNVPQGTSSWFKNVWSKIESKAVSVDASLATGKKDVSDWKTTIDDWWGSKNLGVGASFTSKDKIKEKGEGGWWATIQKWWGTKNLGIGATNTSTKKDAGTWWDKIKSFWGEKTLSMTAKATVTSVTVSKPAQQQMQTSFSVALANASGKPQALPKAVGGIISSPTHVLVGEAGPEAIIPLKNHTEWLDTVSKYVVQHLKLGKLEIPHLARGMVIPPNNQFLALLGDQKSGTNVETPLSTIEQALQNVLKRSSSTNAPIILQLDGRQIAKVVWSESDKRYKQTGKALAY